MRLSGKSLKGFEYYKCHHYWFILRLFSTSFQLLSMTLFSHIPILAQSTVIVDVNVMQTKTYLYPQTSLVSCYSRSLPYPYPAMMKEIRCSIGKTSHLKERMQAINHIHYRFYKLEPILTRTSS